MRNRKHNRPSILNLSLAALLICGAAQGTVQAAMLVGHALTPTTNAVYYQFGTDEPFDAYRAIVRLPGGPIAGVDGGHPHYATLGGGGVVTGLSPGTNYRFILKIRWNHGGPWTTVLNAPFTTDP